MAHWLMKSEPNCFSLDDLYKAPKRTEHWDGVRNYQARNMMRDDMQKGDLAFFYHSSCKVPAIVGIMQVAKQAYPDHTAWDLNGDHFDPKSTPDNPRWFMVDMKYYARFKDPITLNDLKQNPALSGLTLLKRGNRLSIMPVSDEDWQTIMAMGELADK